MRRGGSKVTKRHVCLLLEDLEKTCSCDRLLPLRHFSLRISSKNFVQHYIEAVSLQFLPRHQPARAYFPPALVLYAAEVGMPLSLWG